jgi:hypothetical protein
MHAYHDPVIGSSVLSYNTISMRRSAPRFAAAVTGDVPRPRATCFRLTISALAGRDQFERVALDVDYEYGCTTGVLSPYVYLHLLGAIQ